MSASQPDWDSARGGPRDFRTTDWSLVLAAGQGASPAAEAALEILCRHYWYPLYAFVRGRGYAPEDAQDLTQGFFAQLLRRNFFAHAQREREPAAAAARRPLRADALWETTSNR